MIICSFMLRPDRREINILVVKRFKFVSPSRLPLFLLLQNQYSSYIWLCWEMLMKRKMLRSFHLMVHCRPLTANKDSMQTADPKPKFLILKAILKFLYWHCWHRNKSVFVGDPKDFPVQRDISGWHSLNLLQPGKFHQFSPDENCYFFRFFFFNSFSNKYSNFLCCYYNTNGLLLSCSLEVL